MYSNMNISSFEGAYRRQPNQNLQGASKTCNVSELINKIQIERKKREEARIFTEKATVIQSHYRSYRTRKYWREVFRQQINEKILSIKNGSVVGDFGDLYYLLFRAHYVYPRRGTMNFEDLQSFVFIMQTLRACLRNVYEAMNNDMFWFSYFILTVKLNFEVISCISNKNISDKIALMNNLSYILNPHHIIVYLPRDFYVLDMLWRRILNDDFLLDNTLFVSASFLIDDDLPEEAGTFISDIFRCLIDVSNITPNRSLQADVYRTIGSSFMRPPLTKGLSDFVVKHFNAAGGFPIAGVAQEYWYRPDEEMTREALFRFLSLDSNQTAIPMIEQNNYFILLSKLLRQIYYLSLVTKKEESDGEEDLIPEVKDERQILLEEITALLNNETRSNMWIQYLNYIQRDRDNENFLVFCQCVYLVWLEHYSLIYTHRVLKELFLHPDFLRLMWLSIKTITYIDTDVTPPHLYPTYDMLAHGVIISSCEAEKVVPALTMFCYFLKHQLAIINDAVLFRDPSANHAFFVFTVHELLEISRILKNVTIGIISLAFPTFSFNGCLRVENRVPTNDAHLNTLLWRTLLEQLFGVLRLLHSRDGRRRFTPADFWITSEISDIRQPLNDMEAFRTLIPFSDETNQRNRNIYEDRHLTVLKHIPFLVDFMTRFRLLQSLIQDLKDLFQNPTLTYFHNVYINVNIRRDYIYEDAFNELNIDAVNEIRIPIRVTFVNSVAGEEPGIDGGGVFREFIISFLKSAFDPNRGFFLINAQNEFYPNPNIKSIHKDYKKHYSFMGRMLGKAIYEGILIEIPIADFFLDKLFHCGDNGGQCDLYLCGLASLDPDLYRNLMSLITYDGDFADLELDFTLSVDSFGANNIVELVENGSSIPVTSQNVVEYVHRVGKYKINDQISEQCQAFIEGLTSVIPHHWISMFSTKELQLIISGNESPVDVVDLRRNSIYSEPYSDCHPTIERFWDVVSSFDGNQRGRLLRFVTSTSRAPLLGFKDLFPPFCIQYVEDSAKLPTSSTCMNILKLPNFEDEETMRQKLLYAITANAGFELS